MTGWLHVFMTGDVVRGTESATDDETHGPVVESGYISPSWSMTELQDRNNAGPVLSYPLATILDAGAEWLRDEIEMHLGAYTDNGDGTLYGQDEHTDYRTGDVWTYALHFVRKYYDSARAEYVEVPWVEVSDILAQH